ncbi:MAG TPA: hypothetical protein DEO38_01660, partial [Bacteroidales bacterium]|nr:hypothetical protein [Bacteroidales bacterium]
MSKKIVDNKSFIKRNLFPVRLNDYMSLSGKYDDSAYLLYAPLNKRSMLCSEEQINALRSQLNASGRFSDDNLNRLLLDNQLSQDQGFVCSPRDVYAMTLLP